MRCPKCGFSSFDHLASCSKCGRDLSESRETLNLPDFEPQVPFLLGSLVGETQGGGGGYQQELSLTQETELELGGLEASEESGLDATVDIGSVGGGLEADSDEELKLSEIDLGDLDTMGETDTNDSGASEVQFDDLGELSTEGVESAEEDDGFLGLEFEADEASADDFGALEESLAAQPAGDPAGDDLELDLSEDDLSELAKELEGHLGEEAGGKKKATADDSLAELDEVLLEMEDD